jgi:hypothetical protein
MLEMVVCMGDHVWTFLLKGSEQIYQSNLSKEVFQLPLDPNDAKQEKRCLVGKYSIVVIPNEKTLKFFSLFSLTSRLLKNNT